MKYTHLFSLLAVLVAGSLSAATARGYDRWTVHPVYAPPVQKVIDTGDGMVYYASGGRLFSYDIENDESYSYTTDNRLGDIEIDNIYYNHADGYLVVCYDTGVIDLLYDDGTTVNMSDIAEADIIGSRAINDVCFNDGLIYAATDFGLVVFDESRHEVNSYGIYGQRSTGVTVTSGHVIIKSGPDIYAIPVGERISRLDNWKKICVWHDLKEMYTLADGTILLNKENGKGDDVLAVMEIDLTKYRKIKTTPLNSSGWKSVSYLIPNKNGNYYFKADNKLYDLGSDMSVKTLATLPEELSGGCPGFYSGKESVWMADADGIGHYSFYDGNFTVLSEKYRPAQSSVKDVAYIIPGGNGRFYITNLGPTVYKFGYATGNEGLEVIQTTNLVDNGQFKDVSVYPVIASSSIASSEQEKYGKRAMAPTRLAEDPEDPATYYLGTGNDGVYKITDGKFVGRYDGVNSPLAEVWGYRAFDISIDRGGNLWVVGSGGGNSGVFILPSDKRRLDPDEVKKSDWFIVPIPDYESNKDAQVLHCMKSNMIFIVDAGTTCQLVAIDTRGTFNDFSDDTYRVWNTLTDQDGRNFNPSRNIVLREEHNGRVWMGTNMGVIEINPSNAMSPSMTINRLKVPRNDGTNTADYLVESDMVYDISVDHANRKWFATESSGVYLVSERGDEILKNFTTSNSALPTNRVKSVFVDPNSNSVYFGTEKGFVEYESTSSPAMNDLSNVYAYPNPVRPDDAQVTITGLMDNSLVKIADASGSVVYQGLSEGGMLTWNLQNRSGSRVKTGVYYVFSSKTGEGISSSGSVTKFLVVN